MEAKRRCDVNPENTWNLTAVYPDRAAWRAALKAAEADLEALSALPGTLCRSAEGLKAGLDAIFSTGERAERVYRYAFLCKSGDNGDPELQDMEARALSLLVNRQTALAFVDPEILSIPPEALDAWLADGALRPYRHLVGNIARRRAHTLDARGERLLAMLGDAAQAPGSAFEMFESVDMRFPDVRDEDGKPAPLTHGSFPVYRDSRDRAVRRTAFEAYFGEFGKYVNTLAAVYGGQVKLDCFYAAARGFGGACGACEAALFEDNVPVNLYDGLIEAVHGALPAMRDYLELRRRALGLEALHLYDLYVPMVESGDEDVPFERARAMVAAALRPLGEEYQGLLRRAFEERWSDVYENRGKTTGAFSCGVYGAHPYVLLNYAGKLNDAFTLAHELGHAMHSWFVDAAQDYPNHDYSIFVAEVASTVNEVLLTRYLLGEERDPHRRAALLNHFLEGFRTTVFRQTLFAEFERKAHELQERGEPLTAQALNGVYHELNALYYDGAVIDDFADVEWARIPHFYNAFYVYQYATGFSCAVAIADRILRTGDAADYLRFLHTGGSDYPIEELKLAGVDLTKPDAIRDALRVFADTLEELKGILDDGLANGDV